MIGVLYSVDECVGSLTDITSSTTTCVYMLEYRTGLMSCIVSSCVGSLTDITSSTTTCVYMLEYMTGFDVLYRVIECVGSLTDITSSTTTCVYMLEYRTGLMSRIVSTNVLDLSQTSPVVPRLVYTC